MKIYLKPLHKDSSLDSCTTVSTGQAPDVNPTAAHPHQLLSSAPSGDTAEDPFMQALQNGLTANDNAWPCAADEFVMPLAGANSLAAMLPAAASQVAIPSVPMPLSTLLLGNDAGVLEQRESHAQRLHISSSSVMASICGTKHMTASSRKQLTSRFRGVCWNKKNKRWQAAINSSGKYIYLGSFTSEDEAARHFDRAAIKIRGRKAKTNFDIADYLDSNGELLAQPPPPPTTGVQPTELELDGSPHAMQPDVAMCHNGTGMPLVTTSMPMWPGVALPADRPWSSAFGGSHFESDDASDSGAALCGWHIAPAPKPGINITQSSLAGCNLTEALCMARQAAAEKGVPDLATAIRIMGADSRDMYPGLPANLMADVVLNSSGSERVLHGPSTPNSSAAGSTELLEGKPMAAETKNEQHAAVDKVFVEDDSIDGALPPAKRARLVSCSA